MTNQINVISSDLDGAQLRREIHKNSYFARCDGKEDNEQIQDSITYVGKELFSLPDGVWERVFGHKEAI